MNASRRDDALAIWHAAVAAVTPAALLARPLMDWQPLGSGRLLVVGGGKAGAGMATALERLRPDLLHRLAGSLNVPEGFAETTAKIALNAVRPAGTNTPTEAAVRGSASMVELLASAGPDDEAICLLSGGGSALLPLPVVGVPLEAKLDVTKMLHGCGASIGEMNAVRKHLSRLKGGRLAEGFRGRRMTTFIISDVIGDPLDVIASGPTAPDPTTFADAIGVLERHRLWNDAPPEVRRHLERGRDGLEAETPKSLPDSVVNRIIGNNAVALAAAVHRAEGLGYATFDLGTILDGEAADMARRFAGVVRGHRSNAPCCLIAGGETTVSLGPKPGRGGRNQEFVLALWHELADVRDTVTILSAGTDGEDGPTDTAGAIADARTADANLDPQPHLERHDSYGFFDRAGGLIRSGLTGTNVMDVVAVLIAQKINATFLPAKQHGL